MKLKGIVLGITILLACSSASIASQQTMYEGEVVEWTLQEVECNIRQDGLFRIERKEYETGVEPLTVIYNVTVRNDSERLQSEIVSKTINKYSSTGTGELIIGKNGVYTIYVKPESIESESMTWNITPCNVSVREPVQGNESGVNESDSNEVNETDSENMLEQPNTPENTTKTNTSEKDNSVFRVYTDKFTYTQGERMNISFYVHPLPQDVSITYWIEDFYGKSVKSAYTTSNLNTKHYTVRSFDSPTPLIVKARLEGKENVEDTRVIGVYGEKEEKEEEKTTPTVTLQEVEIEEENGFYATVEAKILTGKSSKRTVYIKAEDDDGEACSYKEKVSVPTHNADIVVTTILPLTCIDKETTHITIIIEGLDEKQWRRIPVLVVKDTIENKAQSQSKPHEKPEIVNTYTRQHYVDENLTWYVRTKGEGKARIEIETDDEQVSESVTLERDGKTSEFTLLKPQERMNITTTIIQTNMQVKEEDSIELKVREKKGKEIMRTQNQLEAPDITGMLTAPKIQTTTVAEEKNPLKIPLQVGSGFLLVVGVTLLTLHVRKKLRK